MTVLFSTLGFHPEKLLGAVPNVPDYLERVVVYTASENEETRRLSMAALRTVEDALRQMEIQVEHREFDSPWDLSGMLEKLIRDLLKENIDEIVFNLTGGPKTMTVAVTLACLFLGVRAIYVPEKTGNKRAIELPLFRIPYSNVLTRGQLRVLRAIEEFRPESLDELAKRLRLKNPTITFHIQKLEQLGAVVLKQDAHDRLGRIPNLTEAGRIMLIAENLLQEKGAGR